MSCLNYRRTFVVARIKEEEISTSDEQTGARPRQSYGLQVTVEAEGVRGKFAFLDKGKVLLPLLIYADNLSGIQKYYLELFWDGTKPEDLTEEHFSIRFLPEDQGAKLVKGVA